MRRWGILVVLAVWLMGAAQAAIQPPDAMVKDTAEKTLEKLRAQRQALRQDPSKIYDLVDSDIIPHLDFERMSKWVLGKYWQSATADQRKRFIDQFKVLLVRTYAKALFEHTDAKVTYLPMRAAADAMDVVVKTEVDQPGAQPLPINYALYLKGDEWKVYDVTIDGVSLVGNYRTTFANEIRQDGLDKLIDTLTRRAQQAAK